MENIAFRPQDEGPADVAHVLNELVGPLGNIGVSMTRSE
jgi:hypothetical protein